MLEKIKNSIPIITIGLIVIGVLKQVIFYENFNVPINYFISLSEIGIIFSYDLVIIGGIFLCVIFSGILEFDVQLENEKQLEDNAEKGEKKARNVFAIVFLTLAVIAFFGMMVASMLKAPYSIKIIGSTCIVFFTLCYKYFDITSRSVKFIKILSVPFLLISMTASILIYTAFQIISIENGKYIGTQIIINDATKYISSDSTFYIGKTADYIFFYNKNDKHTTVIPTSEVKKLELYSK